MAQEVIGVRFDFAVFPRLRAARLDLVELDARFVEDVFAWRSDPVVQLYNSEPHRALEETQQFIAEQRQKYVSRQEITWGLCDRELGRVVGSVSVFGWDKYHRRAQLGYDLAKGHWGKGFAQEAIRSVLPFAFEELELNRVEIWTSAANERSLTLAQRLGFTLEGKLRKRILEDDGQLYDCAVFGLLRDEWARGV